VSARRVTWVLVAATLFYLLLLGQRGWLLLTSGTLLGVLLGIGVVLLPVLGVVLVVKELRFGLRTQLLAEELAQTSGLPVDDLPRRPSGRIDRAAADEVFDRRRSDVEADPDSWGAWYRLGVAYDDAGDRRRARSAMRRAIELHDGLPSDDQALGP